MIYRFFLNLSAIKKHMFWVESDSLQTTDSTQAFLCYRGGDQRVTLRRHPFLSHLTQRRERPAPPRKKVYALFLVEFLEGCPLVVCILLLYSPRARVECVSHAKDQSVCALCVRSGGRVGGRARVCMSSVGRGVSVARCSENCGNHRWYDW